MVRRRLPDTTVSAFLAAGHQASVDKGMPPDLAASVTSELARALFAGSDYAVFLYESWQECQAVAA